jgi:hypothetical protein
MLLATSLFSRLVIDYTLLEVFYEMILFLRQRAECLPPSLARLLSCRKYSRATISRFSLLDQWFGSPFSGKTNHDDIFQEAVVTFCIHYIRIQPGRHSLVRLLEARSNIRHPSVPAYKSFHKSRSNDGRRRAPRTSNTSRV